MIDENLACLLDDSEDSKEGSKEEKEKEKEKEEKNYSNEYDERDENENKNKVYYDQAKLNKSNAKSFTSEREGYKSESEGIIYLESDDPFDFLKRKEGNKTDNHKYYKNEKSKGEQPTDDFQNSCFKGNKRKWEGETDNSKYNNSYDHNINNPLLKKNKNKESISYKQNNPYAKLRNLANTTPDDNPSLIKNCVFKNNNLSENDSIENDSIESDSIGNTKQSTRHGYESRNDCSWDKGSVTSEVDSFHENFELHLSSDTKLNETKLNKDNDIHVKESEKKKNDKQNDKKKLIKEDKYIIKNNKNSKDSLLKENDFLFFNELTDNNKKSLKRTFFEKEKKQKGFIHDANNTNIQKTQYKKKGDMDNSDYNKECQKKSDLHEDSNKSSISTNIVGPTDLRQKLKSFNNSVTEKNKDLVFYYSFIKYKSWIKALSILNLPLNNFHLSINSYKYLSCGNDVAYDKSCTSDTDVIDNDLCGKKTNENFFMYRNNIHNILNNKKISNYKIDRLLVLVKSILSRHNGYFLVVMDPSGHMPATLHKEIGKEHKRSIDVGSTLLLRNVTVFQTIDNFPYLIITLRSLVRVIKAEQTEDELKEKIFNQLQL